MLSVRNSTFAFQPWFDDPPGDLCVLSHTFGVAGRDHSQPRHGSGKAGDSGGTPGFWDGLMMQQQLFHSGWKGLCENYPGKQRGISARPAGRTPGRCWSSRSRGWWLPWTAAAVAPHQERDQCPGGCRSRSHCATRRYYSNDRRHLPICHTGVNCPN